MSYCNRTHNVQNPTLQAKQQRSLPYKFQDGLICAGDKFSSTGVCKGDSGGPLIQYDSKLGREYFVQVGVVHGGIRDCFNDVYPAIFNRLTNREILSFILSNAFNQSIDSIEGINGPYRDPGLPKDPLSTPFDVSSLFVSNQSDIRYRFINNNFLDTIYTLFLVYPVNLYIF